MFLIQVSSGIGICKFLNKWHCLKCYYFCVISRQSLFTCVTGDSADKFIGKADGGAHLDNPRRRTIWKPAWGSLFKTIEMFRHVWHPACVFGEFRLKFAFKDSGVLHSELRFPVISAGRRTRAHTACWARAHMVDVPRRSLWKRNIVAVYNSLLQCCFLEDKS